jgi:ubiquinone/menaquinone biosynthesis C-methylase UbiE
MIVDYDRQAVAWHRDEPRHRSDFCGRPEVLELVRSLGAGKDVLDVGCGEGYFSRKMADIGDKVVGIDESVEMIRLAKYREELERRGIKYLVGDAKAMPFVPDAAFGLCVGNYITNYFRPDELPQFYHEMARVLRVGGRFVLLMPHPAFELTQDYGEAVSYEKDGYDYIKSRGRFFKADLKTIHGDLIEVGVFHSALEDHLQAISSAELSLDTLREPVFPEVIADTYPVFSKMAGKVACMILAGEK